MWASQENKLGQNKIFLNTNPLKKFQGRPRKKIQKCEKILFSALPCFENPKPYLGGLAIFHNSSVCEGVWKITKPPKFGFSFSKQARAETFQMQLVYHRADYAYLSGPIDLKFWFQA